MLVGEIRRRESACARARDVRARNVAAWPGRVAAADDDDLVGVAALRLDVRRGVVDADALEAREVRHVELAVLRAGRDDRPRARAPTRRPRASMRSVALSQCDAHRVRARPRCCAPNFSACASARPASACPRCRSGSRGSSRSSSSTPPARRARRASSDQHVEPFGRAVHGGREPARARAADDDVVHADSASSVALSPRHSATSASLGLRRTRSPRQMRIGMSLDVDVELVEQRLHVGVAIDVDVAIRMAVAARGTPASAASPPSRASRSTTTSPCPSAMRPTRRRMNARMKSSLSSESVCTSELQPRVLDAQDAQRPARARPHQRRAAVRSMLSSPVNSRRWCTVTGSSTRPSRMDDLELALEHDDRTARGRRPARRRSRRRANRRSVPHGTTRASCASVSAGNICGRRTASSGVIRLSAAIARL